MGVFGDYALKYYESGIYVIPTNEKKEPKVKDGFKEDAKKLNVVESWIGKYPDANIAILMGVGKMQNIVAFDIDLDGPLWEDATAEENMTKAAFCLPYSPVFKKGKKGITIFYRYYFQYHKPAGKKIIDFITNGYTVIPPSFYYEKKDLSLNEKYNYKWGPYDLLSFDPEELPELKQEDVDRFFGIFGEDLPKGEKLKNGRDTHISEMCWAALHKNKPRDVVIQELLEIDQRMHETPFATDKKKSKTRGRTPEQVMAHFVDRAIKKLGDKYQPGLEITAVDGLETVVEKQDVMPELPQFLKQLADYFGDGDNQHNGAALTALIFMSVFLGKRIEFKHPKTGRRTAPNLYGFHVGSSGSGKGALKNRFIDMVKHCRDTMGNVCLTGLPKSDAALHRFFQKPVVCMLSEEFHQVLAAIGMGNKNFAAINETLAEIYSASTGVLLEKKAADAKFDADEVVEPYLSLFAATQPVNFKNKILGTKNWGDIFHQGLAARMLFTTDDIGGPSIDNSTGLNRDTIRAKLQYLTTVTTKEQLKAIPKAFEYENGFINLFDAFYLEFKAERDKEDLISNHTSIMAPIISRRLENAIKVAMIYSVCEILENKPLVLKMEHLIRAVDLCKYFERILDRLVYGDQNNDEIERVFERIKSSGQNLSQRDIATKNKQKSQDVAVYIATLLSQKRIEAISFKPLRGPAKITYKIKEN